MELTWDDYYRLQPLYPQSDFEKKGEPLRMACQAQKRAMCLHIAKERYADIKPLWLAIIRVRQAGFSFNEVATILDTDVETIYREYDRILQNAQ